MFNIESIGHILTICPQMSSRFYGPLRHYDCLLDLSTAKKVNEKLVLCSPPVKNLQIMCSGYKFQIAYILVREMGYVPKCLVTWSKLKVKKSNCQ